MRQLIAALAAVAAIIVIAIGFKYYREGQIRRIAIDNNSLAREVGLMMTQYEQDNNGYMPPASRWESCLQPYNQYPKITFHLETFPGLSPHRLAMNKYLSGVNSAAIGEPARIILLYEKATTTPNASGAPKEALTGWGRQSPRPAINCADGHMGYEYGGCGSHDDFQYSSDPHAMGLR